jgi:hypothetical protein
MHTYIILEQDKKNVKMRKQVKKKKKVFQKSVHQQKKDEHWAIDEPIKTRKQKKNKKNLGRNT